MGGSSHQSPGRFQGCRRGVFGLRNWDPARQPAATALSALSHGHGDSVSEHGSLVGDSRLVSVTSVCGRIGGGGGGATPLVDNRSRAEPAVSSYSGGGRTEVTCGEKGNIQNSASRAVRPVARDQANAQPVINLIVKYAYNAVQNSPLGFDSELTVKIGDFVTKVEEHPEQPLWWLVKNSAGRTGYVPASYLHVHELKPTALPWLKNKPIEEVLPPVSNQPYKPYKSAYASESTGTAAAKPSTNIQWRCDVCDKNLNGPQPYTAHMNSRAHKDEVAAQAPYE